MSTVIRPRAAFGTARKNVLGVLARAWLMYKALLDAGTAFPSPPIALAAFLALIEATKEAQDAALTRNRGTASTRDVKRDALWTAMESLRIYVQGLADVLSVLEATELILKAGLLVGRSSGHGKILLKATLTSTPGVVDLVANATALTGGRTGKKVTFHWQWSGDDQRTWNSVTSTPHADTQITGLPLMATYWFRVSITKGKDIGEWSQSIGLLVH